LAATNSGNAACSAKPLAGSIRPPGDGTGGSQATTSSSTGDGTARGQKPPHPETKTPTVGAVGVSNDRSRWLVSGSSEMLYRASILAPSLAQERTAAKLTISGVFKALMPAASSGGANV